MNVFMYELATGEVDPTPAKTSTKFVIEDNVGEGIHIHLRNFRLELSIDDFRTFAENVRDAQEVLKDGNR